MDDHRKQALCRLLQQEVKALVDEWLDAPLRWLQEIDVQCDLARRIHGLLAAEDLLALSARHSAFSGMYTFSRLACEPYVKMKDRSIHPDIVVWDDCDDASVMLNRGRWPILWACEIKYTNVPPAQDDLHRLLRLSHDPSKVLYAGCWLSLVLSSEERKKRCTEREERLWVVEAMTSALHSQRNEA